MSILTLRLNKEKLNKLVSKAIIPAMHYTDGNDIVLLDTESVLDLMALPEGESKILMPPDWRGAKITSMDNLDDVLFDNGEVDWDHHKLNHFPHWAKDTPWIFNVTLTGLKVEATGDSVDGYAVRGYQLKVIKTNMSKGIMLPPGIDFSQFAQGKIHGEAK